MKKGLSVLLIAAALFGFYGGAVNLNDVLACKDYWEEEGEKSTADMNKLEDGLNQLKDNEKAYLDGLQQVADGEEALAQGEADYAAGQAELAQGEADYAAAPGKLADARAQIAQGEKDLAAGEKKLAAGYNEYNQGKADFAAAPAKLAAAEKQIAAGEKELAVGEATLAAGYAAYEQGQKDYEEAPAKLKAGEEALEAGKAQLEEGRTASTQLDGLIDGLKSAKEGFENQWQPGFEKQATKPDYSDAGLKQARQIITNTVNTDENKKNIGLIEQLTKTKDLAKNLNEKASYAEFDEGVQGMIKAFTEAKQTLQGVADLAKENGTDTGKTQELKAGLKANTQVPVSAEVTAPISSLTLAQTEQVLAGAKTKLEAGKTALAKLKEMKAEGATTIGDQMAALLELPAATPIDTAIAGVQNKVDDLEKRVALLTALIGGRKQVVESVKDVLSNYGDYLTMAGSLDPRLGQLGDLMKSIANDDMKNGDFATAFEKMQGGLLTLADTLNTMITEKIDPNVASFTAWDKGYKQLADGQASIASTDVKNPGVPVAFAGMLNNGTIRKVLEDKAPKLIPALTLYSGNRLASDDMQAFDEDMDSICKNVIPNALAVLQGIKAEVNKQIADGEAALEAGEKELEQGRADYAAAPAKLDAAKAQLAQGENELAEGRAKLAAGKEEYAQGLADYKAAPAKLAAAEKQLAKGEKDLAAGKAKLAAGKKQYAKGLADFAAAPGKLEAGRAALAEGLQKLMDGRKELAEGKDKLAEYEDGEQQVRDGLATLMGTEANGGLTSIYDRRNGDDDFDNGDTHLDLDEGLDAVEVGRGYQADSGVLITKEITNRAIGTAAGLGAGALAVLAAILSLLKKNKGAGISAILSAVAGGAGIAAGTSAGMEFSNIAGSTAGSTPWIAFGVLAAVALVHAIAHFASKEA